MLLFAQAETSADVQDQIFDLVGNSIYGILGLLSLWGLYLVVMTWRRVGAKRFKNEKQLNQFLVAVEEPLLEKNFEGVAEICDRDKRAMAQLVFLAVLNRALADRFRRDILADLENRCSLINTVVKSAPMVGLFGTVIGMMGAFGKLATADQVDPAILAGNIMVALITTASGLAIAIPLTIMLAFINIRIRKMEDMVGAGLTRFLPGLKHSLDD
jgi:biopolymer transport protein ExbB/TolQ